MLVLIWTEQMEANMNNPEINIDKLERENLLLAKDLANSSGLDDRERILSRIDEILLQLLALNGVEELRLNA